MKFLQISYWVTLIAIGARTALLNHSITIHSILHFPHWVYDTLIYTVYWGTVFFRLSFGFIFWLFKEKKWIIWLNYIYLPIVLFANIWKPITGTSYHDMLYSYLPLLALICTLQLLRYVSWFAVKARPIKKSLEQLTVVCILYLFIGETLSLIDHYHPNYLLYACAYYLGLIPAVFSAILIKKTISWIREEKQIVSDITSIHPNPSV
jgi:hypothetical protein